MQLIWTFPIIGVSVGIVFLLVGWRSDSAVQQAAAAAIACAAVSIPYVLARIYQNFVDADVTRTQTKLLASIANALAEKPSVFGRKHEGEHLQE